MVDTESHDLHNQLNRMFPDQPIKQVQRLSSTRNRVYWVDTDDNQLVIKLAPAHACASLLREYEAICELHAQYAPVPRPIPVSGSTDFHLYLDGDRFHGRAYEFVEGVTPAPSEQTFYELGRSIGNLHNAWKIKRKPEWVPEVRICDFIHKPLEAISSVYNHHDDLDMASRLARSVSSVLEAHLDNHLFGFSHGDAHHYNAIQTNEGRIMLFDLEDLGWQWRVYDLATAIWGTFGRGGSAPIWNQLIVGYTSVRSIREEEAQLIRFLIFARHLWWLGLHARNWHHWPQRYTRQSFFKSGIELLAIIGKDVCGLDL